MDGEELPILGCVGGVIFFRIVCDKPLEGFKPAQPVVFCGLYPQDTSDLPLVLSRMFKSLVLFFSSV